MKKYRLMLSLFVESGRLHVDSKVVDLPAPLCAQEIFEIFRDDPTTNRVGQVLPRDFVEAYKAFSFEILELPESA